MRRAALLLPALVLAGCASTGGIAPTQALHDPARAGAVAGEDTPWPDARWWTAWGDPRLDALIARALAEQPGLAAVQARIAQAGAAVDAAGAARRPQVNAAVELTDQRFTKNGLVPAPLAGSVEWNNSAQVSASWELDLFGRQRATLDAAVGRLRAAQAERRAAELLLAGNIARGWIDLGRQLELRALLAQGLHQREQVLALVRQRIAAGLDTTVEQRQAEGVIAQTRVEIEALGEQIARTRHALAALSGQGPQALADLAPPLAGVTPMPLPRALPADLVGRRADLVAQRWRVEAALKDVDLARTQFYPNVNLVAFVGLSSLGLDRFVEGGSRTYGAGPALRLPIFDGGRLRANLTAQSAAADAAVDGYNDSLLQALREVADEVASLQSLERQQAEQVKALAAAESAFDLAVQRYRAGLGNFLVVLTAEGNVIAQRRASVELKARHLAAEVALTRALGGGYRAEGEAAPPAVAAARH